MKSFCRNFLKSLYLTAIAIAVTAALPSAQAEANRPALEAETTALGRQDSGFQALLPETSGLKDEKRADTNSLRPFIKLAQYYGNQGRNGGGRGHGHRHRHRHHGGGGYGIIIDVAPIILDQARRHRRHKKRRVHRHHHNHKKVHRHRTKKKYKYRAKKRTRSRKKTVKKTRTPNRRIARTSVAAFPKFHPNEVVLMMDNAQPKSVDLDLARVHKLIPLGVEQIPYINARIVRCGIIGKRSPASVIAALRADPRISLVQKNNFYYLRQQTARRATSSSHADMQYALAKLGVPHAHTMSYGRDILVAVIDSGIDGAHPDLRGAVAEQLNAVGDKVYKTHAHGTAIAGIIGARGKLQGMAPQADLLAIRAFYTNSKLKKPQTTTFILLRAIAWAMDRKARVINLSFSGPRDELVERMLNKAHERGTILVAAAGNGGRNAPPAYPAAYENVIAITATDQADRLYSNANRGGYLALAAPGVDVMVLGRKNSYGFSSGTSLAAAHISGVIALMLERNPDASTESIKKAIISTAHDLGPKGPDAIFGAGRADAYRSVQAIEKVRATTATNAKDPGGDVATQYPADQPGNQPAVAAGFTDQAY